MLYALATLLVLQLIGEVLVQSLHLPVPGPLIGMLLLFGALMLRGGVPDELRKVGDTLLQNMMLLFIPAVAGVMMLFERVGQEWLPFVTACVGGAALTMGVTALVLQLMLRITRRRTAADQEPQS